jgi:hypothetical protein
MMNSWMIKYRKAQESSSIVELEELANVDDDNMDIVFSVYYNSNCPPKLKSALNSCFFLKWLANS